MEHAAAALEPSVSTSAPAIHVTPVQPGAVASLRAATLSTSTVTSSTPAVTTSSGSVASEGKGQFCCVAVHQASDICGTCWPNARVNGSEGNWCGRSRAHCDACKKTWCSSAVDSGGDVVVMGKRFDHRPLRETRPTAFRTTILGSLSPTMAAVTASGVLLLAGCLAVVRRFQSARADLGADLRNYAAFGVTSGGQFEARHELVLLTKPD
jgi:hypothetical protein